MIRTLLLVAASLLLLIQQYLVPLPLQLQLIIFLVGIALLGIPHGAADLLVASQNAEGKKTFSTSAFHFNYLARLIGFALLFYIFPLGGNLLFIIFSAYHFGETDLYHFKINGVAGKLLIVSYGLLILAVILIHHFESLLPLFALFDAGKENIAIINAIDHYRNSILFLCVMFLLVSFVWYVFTNKATIKALLPFLIRYAIILFLLYNLPMILGFTFYFIAWHSLFSLRNVVTYLRKDGLVPLTFITKQISIYSLISFGGFALLGLSGFILLKNDSLVAYIFILLAVLTAPHMEVMHNMYSNSRFRQRMVKE